MLAETESMTASQLQEFDDFMVANLGLVFGPQKKSFVERHLLARMRLHHIETFDEYLRFVRAAGDSSEEFLSLAELLTNNESYFFRETYQFNALYRDLEQRTQRGALRILSAGCSTGEEAYTLNMYAQQHAAALIGYQFSIDAFDIDRRCIATARTGRYRQHSLRNTPPDSIERFFRAEGSGEWLIDESLGRSVTFQNANILKRETWGAPAQYDIIFCRNVLIYFAGEATQRAVENLGAALRSGGYLFLGHAESIIGASSLFTPVRLEGCIAYRRVT